MQYDRSTMPDSCFGLLRPGNWHKSYTFAVPASRNGACLGRITSLQAACGNYVDPV